MDNRSRKSGAHWFVNYIAFWRRDNTVRYARIMVPKGVKSPYLNTAVLHFAELSKTAEIAGTEGLIHIPSRWHRVSEFEWKRTGEDWQTITLPTFTNGFEFQIAEVVRCLDKGLIESPSLPHAFSLQLSETMDEIRKQIEVSYENEL